MRKKNFFRKTAILLIVSILCTVSMQVFAILSPGLTEYVLDESCVVEQNEVTLNNSRITFKKGGSVVYDLLLPFDSDCLFFEYESQFRKVNLTIETDENTYNCTFNYLTKSYQLPIKETYGSKKVRIHADNQVDITSIKFKKIDEKFNETASSESELSDYEYSLLTSVAVMNGSAAIKSKGAIRRLDIKDINTTPKNIEGRMYVPLKVIAEELSLYCEDYPDKSYILLRGDGMDLVLFAGRGYIEHDSTGRREVTVDVVYQDGTTWVPLRKLAETMGLFVAYKDGVAVIDDRLSAQKVVSDETIFNKLTEELSAYVPEVNNSGKTYHVAKTDIASDSNSGTSMYPFATIGKACDVAVAGDTVIIHEGTYREVLRPKNDGTEMKPIVFKAADGENVVISALEPISGFVRSTTNPNIYYASVDVDLGMGRNQIFYKGSALTEGRHPNVDTKPGIVAYPDGVPDIWPIRGNISVKEYGSNIATSDTDLSQQQVDYWKGGTFVTLKGFGWSLVSGDIIGSSYGQLMLADHENSMSYNLGISGSKYFGETQHFYADVHDSDYGYITNHINTVDMPGEWYVGNKLLNLYPPANADLANDFEIKQRQLVVDLRERQFITLKNIDTIGGGITLSGENTEGCILDGGTHKYISHFTRCTDPMGTYILPDDNYEKPGAPQLGEVGICVSGQNNTIINSTIDYSAASGVYLVGKYNRVHNCIVSNTSYSGSYPGGITIMTEKWLPDNSPAGGHSVTHNTIYNSGRGGLNCFPVANEDGSSAAIMACELAYNRVFNGALTTRDTGVTYEYGTTAGNDKSRTKFHHNYVYNAGYRDEDTKEMLMLLYQDGLMHNQECYYNLTFDQNLDLQANTGIHVANSLYSVIRTKNNTHLGYFPEGLDGLKTDHFPSGKPFFAGSYMDGRDRFMLNYNNLKYDTAAYYPEYTNDPNDFSFDFEDASTLADTPFSVGGNATADIYDVNGDNKLRFTTNGQYTPNWLRYVFPKAITKGRLEVSLRTSVWTEDHSGSTQNLFIFDTALPEADATMVTSINYDIGVQRFTKSGDGNPLPMQPERDINGYFNLKAVLEREDTTSNWTLNIYDMNADTPVVFYSCQYTNDQFVSVRLMHSFTMAASSMNIYFDDINVKYEEYTGTVFDNVQIPGDSYNRLTLYYTREAGDSSESMFNATVNVYNESGTLVDTVFTNLAMETHPFYIENVLNEGCIIIPPMNAGKYSISVELSDKLSTVRKMGVEVASSDVAMLYEQGFLYGGSFDDWIDGGGDMPLSKAVVKNNEVPNYEWRGGNYQMWNTWGHTAVFKNRKIDYPTDTIDICYSTGTGYRDQKVTVYVDSMDTVPIATVRLGENINPKWKPVTESFPLNYTLEPGEHTFYFVFDSDEGTKCSNVYHIRFHNSNPVGETGGDAR